MLTLEHARREARELPAMAKGGLVGLVFAGLADLIAHLDAAGHVEHLHQHTSAEFSAHLAGFVSMVLILLGVVVDGVRQSRARRRSVGRSRKGVA